MLFENADTALRVAVLRRFAETKPGGSLVRCAYCPPRKVVFASQDAVKGAIAQFEALGHHQVRAYPCYEAGTPGLQIWHYTRDLKHTANEPEEAAADAS